MTPEFHFLPDSTFLGDYLNQVDALHRSAYYPLNRLRRSSENFGIRPGQMESLIKVVRSTQILPFTVESRYSRSQPYTSLERTHIPSLGLLAFYGTNELFYAPKPETTTLGAIYPTVEQLIEFLKTTIPDNSDFLKRFPHLLTLINDPQPPQNPETLIKKQSFKFNPELFLVNQGILNSYHDGDKNDPPSIEEIRQQILADYNPEPLLGHKDPSDKGVIEVDWSKIDLKRLPDLA